MHALYLIIYPLSAFFTRRIRERQIKNFNLLFVSNKRIKSEKITKAAQDGQAVEKEKKVNLKYLL